MKKLKRLGTVALSSLMLFGAIHPALAEESVQDQERKGEIVEFTDTKGENWAAENIGRMKMKGIFQGYQDGTFRPNAPVTRLQSVITAVRLLGLEEEAKNNESNERLPYKDSMFFEKNQWAKGYVLTALEKGLLDPAEELFLPNQPAKRVWISNLLINALDLGEEAEKAMDEPLDFKDSADIPADAVGYVTLANEYGIFNGNEQGLFKPNANITRAQMAAVLDRTYSQMLEENGALTVSGIVTAVDVDRETKKGTVTVKMADGEEAAYGFSSDLLVQYHNRFMNVDQIFKGDHIELCVENGQVVEAAIFDEAEKAEAQIGIQKMKVEFEGENDVHFELKYESKKGKEKAEVEVKTKNEKKELKGEEAAKQVAEYVTMWVLTPDMGKDEIRTAVLSSFDGIVLKELEIEVRFSNGTKIEVEEYEEVDADEKEAEEEDDDQKEDKDKHDHGEDDKDDEDSR